jgi:nitroimidazol reductase NimA-like FMN-containing flavoprotein (pyridoxamine 5'-phosphate oxidase superfamily)
MRRKDREISDLGEIESIIQRSDICRLAFCDRGKPYVVPLCFGYRRGAIYFHSAREGRKLDMLRNDRRVCFEMDIDQELIRSIDRCSMRYRSVIGSGLARIVEERDVMAEALDLIMRHYRQEPFIYSEETRESTVIIKVEIEELTGKACGY